MSNSGGAVHVGSPPADFQLEDVQLVHFHDFANLQATKGTHAASPIFWCAGYKWILSICPGGTNDSRDGNIAVGLYYVSPRKISAAIEISVKNTSKKFALKGRWNFSNHEEVGVVSNDFMPCEAIVREWLGKNGTLTFEVRIRPGPKYCCNTAKAHQSLSENMLALFLRENNKDVAFEVKGDIISAHRAVLRAQAPDLAELCETYDMTNPMPIDDVEPSTFKLMIEYLYDDKNIDIDEWEAQSSYLVDPDKHSKSILRAAGKYGLTSLKSEAEMWYLKVDKLEVDNVIDNLLYADGNHLLLLKEATMKFIAQNSKSVVASKKYKELLTKSPTLLNEVVLALSNQLSLMKE